MIFLLKYWRSSEKQNEPPLSVEAGLGAASGLVLDYVLCSLLDRIGIRSTDIICCSITSNSLIMTIRASTMTVLADSNSIKVLSSSAKTKHLPVGRCFLLINQA
jgi:hypothetical protein